MNVAQTKAWEHLTDLEKSILSLIIVSQKTKQEASIVLNIYPYKFTEYYNRARKLFTVFTDYYDRYDNLVPTEVAKDKLTVNFVSMVLVHRRKPAELVGQIPDFQELAKPGEITHFWERLLRTVQIHSSSHCKDFYNLLRIFDQWNNFRVLPSEYRDPSPFPRRRNREFKKIHKQLHDISQLGWGMVYKKFGTDRPPLAFIPTMEVSFSFTSVRLSRNSLTYFTKNRLPVFSKEKQAEEFAEASYDFENLSRVSTYAAQKYWANFRLRLQSAINYNELLNIRPGDLRDFTIRDRQFIKKATTKPEATKKLPKNQSDAKQFY